MLGLVFWKTLRKEKKNVENDDFPTFEFHGKWLKKMRENSKRFSSPLLKNFFFSQLFYKQPNKTKIL